MVDNASRDKAALEYTVKSLQAKVSDLRSEVSNTLDKLMPLSEYPFSRSTVDSSPLQLVQNAVMEETCFSLSDNLSKEIQANEIRMAVLKERNIALHQALRSHEKCTSTGPCEIVSKVLYSLAFSLLPGFYD